MLLFQLPETVLKIAKGFTVKSQKIGDKDVNVAHLKFADLLITRDMIDSLCVRGTGWAQAAFFDELGAPTVPLVLVLPPMAIAVSGIIRGTGNDEEALRLMQASLTGIELRLVSFGALMAGELAWIAAGDEVTDVDALLGKHCVARWELSAGGQMSLLDSEQGQDPDASNGATGERSFPATADAR